MELFFREEGSKGKNIIIIHGLYGSSDNWLTIGRKLSTENHVYLIDQRNHGASPHADSHSYQDMTDDLNEFFKTHQIDKAVIIGHSMGGKTAMRFAADYPEKVEKLIIADIAPKDYFDIKDESQYYFHKNILEAYKETQLNEFTSRREVADFLKLKLEGESLVQFLLKNVQRNKETKTFECKINVDILYNWLDEIIRGVDYKWFEDRKPILNYPVLFLKGENSNYISEEDKKSISSIFPEAKIQLITNAGHWLHAEQPQQFIEAITSFI